MVGKYEIEIYNNRVHFQFEIKRNITIIQGDSATGKSTLIQLVADYERLGKGSGITLKCDKPCAVLNSGDWQNYISNTKGYIIFLDENMPMIKTKEFADLVNSSDNYYVIIYRDSLPQLSYSIDEIYGMKEDRESQKYVSTKRVYNSLYNIYNMDGVVDIIPDIVVTEDSNAGHEFFSKIFSCPCISAEGKSNIHSRINEISKTGQYILAIVDGAAFGADMQKFVRNTKSKNVKSVLYAPESFEYLLLISGIIDIPKEIVEQPYNYADSKLYLSWERFFTEQLLKYTRDTIYQYSKTKLNKIYIASKNIKKIKEVLPKIIETD